MIFDELTLDNFRQFVGEQTVRFANDSQKNVTVIHGFNGSGKTTLLNAFTWLLYGEFSPDFEAGDYLESEAAFSQLPIGDRLNVRVKAVFRDGFRRYTAERTATVEKDEQGARRLVDPGTLRLIYIDDLDPEAQEPNNPQVILEQMLPKHLYPFFLFNGERIERLARADAYEQIGDGVRTLLDIELFDRSIRHLELDASRRLRQEIAQHAGEEGQNAKEALDRLLEEEEQLKENQVQLERNQASLEEERETIDTKLASIPDLAKWQAERKAAEDRQTSLLGQLKQRKSELAKEISRNGYLLLVPDVLKGARTILDGARQKGEIPGPIKRQFVEDLLNAGRCICGHDLTEGTEEFERVAQWKEKAFSDVLETAVTVTQARIDSFAQRGSDCIQRIQELERVRDELQTQLRRTQEELDELSAKIGSRDHGEDPQRLEQRRREIADAIANLKMEIRLGGRKLEELHGQILAKQREIETIKIADEEGKLAQRRLDAVSNVLAALKQIREIRYMDLREDLSRQLSTVWSGIAIKDYQARLDDEFRLRLTKEVGGQEEPVRGASTGEKQVLSLAFVGALSAKARSTHERSSQPSSLFRGGLYPLVIDSAFGNLEVEYRRDVAKWIPTLSPQVILMVSESQFREEVAQELRSRIGREWILKCETRKNASREISINGTNYPYVTQSSDGHERTTFEEVAL